MPLYEYRCDACGRESEYLQGFREPDPTVCPHCGESRLHRVVSRVSFRLKGSGWYETDFKKEGRRNVAEDGAGAEKPASAEGASASPAPAGGDGGPAKSAGEASKPAATPAAAGTPGGG
jgi:putative FmdB family regulatory protein